MRNYSLPIATLFVFSIFVSCEDFIEKNIEGKSITILAPPDSLNTSSLTQTFWWDELDGAESYNIQIVKGSFSYVLQFILDSNVVTNKFPYTLQPGTYAWRVKGLNNAGETPYTTHTLIIDSTLNLTNQVVNLISPADQFVTNNTAITFSWSAMYNADEYRIQITEQSTGSVILDTLTSSTSYSTLLGENEYIWKVRAENSISITQYFSRTLFIDLTPPQAPYNLLPVTGTIVNNGDSLLWSVDTTSVADSLYIYPDTVINPPTIYYTTNTFYILNSLTPKTYYWKVNSMDAAGNVSSFSALSKFVFQ